MSYFCLLNIGQRKGIARRIGQMEIKMTYNLKDIMTHAWNIFRKVKRWKFGTCLKKAWAAAKQSVASAAGRTVLTPARETDKALCFEATAVCEATDQERRVTVWLPKSQIKNGQASAWIIEQKAADIRERFNYRGTLAIYGVTDAPFFA